MPQRVTIGVLALQGAFIEHIHYLQRLRPKDHVLHVIPVRNAHELATCDALVVPGGESTVMESVAARTPGLLEALKEFVKAPEKPVWGTCAGMILMSEEEGIGGGKVIKGRPRQRGWGGIKGMKVWRNLYGTQLESFEAPLTIPELSDPQRPFNAIFIRAPAVFALDPSAESHSGSEGETQVLAMLPEELQPAPPPSDEVLGEPNVRDLGKVMLRQGNKMATSFHPELSGDVRIHEYWVEKCVLGRR